MSRFLTATSMRANCSRIASRACTPSEPAPVGVAAPGLVDLGEVGVVAPVAGRPAAAGCPRRRCPAWRRRCAPSRAASRVLAELATRRRDRPARACARSCCSAGSSRPATSATASSSSVTRCGKASRKKPEMRTVTSMRGRPSSSSGIALEPDHAARLGVPDRPHAEQREDLAGVVAVRCASRPCPTRRSRPSPGTRRPRRGGGAAARRPAGARLEGEVGWAAPCGSTE